jgi:hypothetical protein
VPGRKQGGDRRPARAAIRRYLAGRLRQEHPAIGQAGLAPPRPPLAAFSPVNNFQVASLLGLARGCLGSPLTDPAPLLPGTLEPHRVLTTLPGLRSRLSRRRIAPRPPRGCTPDRAAATPVRTSLTSRPAVCPRAAPANSLPDTLDTISHHN